MYISQLSSVVSDTLPPHGLQHTRLPCPSPTPRACSNSIHWVSNAIQSSQLLLLPSIFPSIRVVSSDSVLCIRWPEYWSFSFSISPSNEYSGLITFRMDWLDLLAVQGTLKSLLMYGKPIQYCKVISLPKNKEKKEKKNKKKIKSRDVTLSTKFHLVKAVIFQ